MRYKILLPSMLLFALPALRSEAQLYNNGASIKIQPNAIVFVAGEVQNNAGGTISNDGKLEVQGNFTNNATYTSATADDSLILSGANNTLLNGGAATINYLTINKTTNANTVTLAGTTLLGKKLDYTSGGFSTDPVANPTFVFSAPITAVFNYAAGREINGSVRRTGWANGTSVMFNQTNMLVATNTGTAPSNFTVTMLPGADPTQAEREVKRKFKFAQTGGTGFTTDVRFAYQDAELNTNTEPTLTPWQLTGGEWNSKAVVNRDASANYVGTTTIAAADLANEWKLADARYTFNATAFLRGAWNGSNAMDAFLNDEGIIPLSQPYNVSPYNYAGTETVASIPNANVVDWVLVELRKPVTGVGEDAIPATIIGSKAGFLLKNGTVVNTDGVTPVSFDISKQGGAFVVVRHLNHLGVMSKLLPSNVAGTFTNDFSLIANVFKPAGAASDPEVLLDGGSGKYGFWAGDANKDGTVNAPDLTAIKLAIAASASGYLLTDINMNSAVNAIDVSIAKITIGNSGEGSGAKKIVPTTNIPSK